MDRDALVNWLDFTLDTAHFVDKSLNGLQIEGKDTIQRVAVAVDACQATIDAAVAADADMLIVHHGLFWGRCELLKGAHGRRVRAAMKGNLNLYCSHLPLDAHPQLGNNARLAQLLQLQEHKPWGGAPEQLLGAAGTLDPALGHRALASRLQTLLRAPVQTLPFGPDRIRRVAVVSGLGTSLMDQALHDGFDALVTGEGNYGSYFLAEEGGLALFFAGHYATETLGVQALAQRLQEEHALDTQFIDHPTGT